MQIVNLSREAIIRIAEASSRADAEGRKFRIAFNPENLATCEPASICYKVGEGMWSAPFTDQPDEYRDNGRQAGMTETVYLKPQN